jgi:hypothetical protein
MATKKAAPPAKPQGKQLQPWEQRAAERAAAAQATAQSAGGASQTVNTRGGRFTIDGAEVPDNVLRCVILDSCLDNHMYEDDFDPDNPSNPVCWALGRYYLPKPGIPDEDLMGPDPALVEDPKSVKCHDCEFGGKNAWGTADKGRGKACKNTRRLLLMSEGDLEEDVASAEVRKLTVPVTSGRTWDGYVNQVGQHNRDPAGVLTEINIRPDPKTQFKIGFKMLGLIEDDNMSEVLNKADSVQDELFAPYGKDEEGEREERPARNSKAVSKGSPQRKPAPRRR